MSELVFFQLAAILAIAFLVSYIIRLLKQPLIIGYIIAGVLVSPFLVVFSASADIISIFSKIGIAFLLFMVGLHLNPKVIKEIGGRSLLIGLGQMLLTFALTFIISLKLLGLDASSSFYLGIAIALSSTIIVMKLLSDKRQLDSLYGKISIGILIVQDFVAVAVLMFISTMSNGANFGALALKTFFLGIGLIIGLFLFGYILLLRITKGIARSQELLFLFSVCWCFVVAALFAYFGFSIEIGALLAGMVLSLSPYSTEISSKIRPLRDFFLIIFFIILGLNINLFEIKEIALNAVILSAIALVLKPIITMFFMAIFKYTKRANFLVGISLAQISEFSLIIAMLGVSLGHISPEILYTLTLTLVLTILGSTYMIIYSKKIYESMPGFISVFERKGIKETREKFRKNYEIVLFGYNRTGFDILKELVKLKKPYLVVDFNPDTIATLNRFRVPCMYGDIDDPELLKELHLDKIRLAISTVPDYEANLLLVEHLKSVNPDAVIIARADNIHDAFELYKKGADYVLTPNFLGGEYIAGMIKNFGAEQKAYSKEKEKHLERLGKILKRSTGKLRLSPYSSGRLHYSF